MSMLIGKVEPGDVIGRCRIIRELGRGGVGTVYLARHQTLQIEVALKVLSPALSLDQPALAERFIREAQLAARIRHPNVIAVMDAAHDEPTGLYYIVFEYVGGGALAWHLRNGPLPEQKALGIMIGIAQALVVAEENNIVHRDIKPENIMLDARGAAKLADLGLAKHDLDSRTSLTMGGSYMGTPAYMSPEQARDAKAADTRDDIYSLGATFYECLTGDPPFTGETPYNIMSELLTKPSPKVSDRRPEVSRCVDMICRKMMAKTRGLRYGDARALLHDLQQFQLHGDGCFNRLEAANFATESVMARQKALQHGVHTSAENVLSDQMSPNPPILRKVRSSARPVRSEDEGAFRAAVWLVALVIIATALFAFVGRHTLLNQAAAPVAAVASTPAKKPSAPVAETTKPKPKHHESGETKPADTGSAGLADQDVPPRAVPVALPVVADTNVAPALSVTPSTDTNLSSIPIVPPVNPAVMTNVALGIVPSVLPVAPAAPQSAFAARDVAEAALNPTLITGTGKASLLKAIGRREPGSPLPLTWTYYFYDTSATGNARFLTVRGGRVVKDGQDLPVALSPWHSDDIVAEDKLRIDSDAALAAAQALIPNVPITSSQFELTRPKNSAPMWRVTVWAKDSDGQEQEIGTVQILADTGYVLRNDLKPSAL
jgi:serine/threonine protein kinase